MRTGAQRRPTIVWIAIVPAVAPPRLRLQARIDAPPRRGLIVVLIGMAVATMIFLSVLKLIAVQRQSVELQTRQIQAGWLAESAVQRACGTAFRRSQLPRRNLEHFRTRHRRTRRRHDRDPRGRSPRQARSPHGPRRGRLPGRSLPTGPAGPRGDRSIKANHRTNEGAAMVRRPICRLQSFRDAAVLRSSNCWSSSPSSA